MIFGEGPVVRPSGDLFQSTTTKPPPVAAVDIAIAIAIRVGAVRDRLLIRRMLVSSSKTQGFVGVASEVAERHTKSVGRVVKTLYKTQPRPDLLLHLAEEMCEAIRAVQASRYNLKVDFSCYLRQSDCISFGEHGRQSITSQNIANSTFGYADWINDRFCSASTIPPLTRMPALWGIRPQEDVVIIFCMRSANPGIVAASPRVPFDLKGFRLEVTVQYFGISSYDRGDDRVIGVHGHPDCGQSVCNLAPKLVTDGRQIDSTNVDRDTAGKGAVQATYRCGERIIDDAVEESVGHNRKLRFQINKAIQHQDEGALPA